MEITYELDFVDISLMFFQLTYHLIIQNYWFLSRLNQIRMRDVPYTSNIIFIATGDNPVAVWRPRKTAHHLGVLFDLIYQLAFIFCKLRSIGLISCRSISSCIVLGEAPNKYHSFLADSSKFVSAFIEFAVPNLFFVSS